MNQLRQKLWHFAWDYVWSWSNQVVLYKYCLRDCNIITLKATHKYFSLWLKIFSAFYRKLQRRRCLSASFCWFSFSLAGVSIGDSRMPWLVQPGTRLREEWAFCCKVGSENIQKVISCKAHCMLRLTLPACVCCHQANGTQPCQVSWAILWFSFCFKFKRTIGIIENEKGLTFWKTEMVWKRKTDATQVDKQYCHIGGETREGQQDRGLYYKVWMVMVTVIM